MSVDFHLDADIHAARTALQADGVIAYPTEAVYGLGCNPHSDIGLQRILDLKHRAAHKGFILIAADQNQLAPYLAPLQPAWQSQLDAAWPGPVTFVIPAANTLPALLTGQRNTVAVRVSDHPTVRRLCLECGGAIVSTSANRSGAQALRTGSDVRAEFGNTIDVIVDGKVGSLASPTRIIDIQSGRQLR